MKTMNCWHHLEYMNYGTHPEKIIKCHHLHWKFVDKIKKKQSSLGNLKWMKYKRQKNPIILSRNDTLTRFIIQEMHCWLLDSSPAHTLAEIQNKYEIPKERMEVKKILKKCLIYACHHGGPHNMKPMGPWLKMKVKELPAFKHTGLDYFGPLHIKQNKERKKTWLCIFTCITVRAIHLELIEDNSCWYWKDLWHAEKTKQDNIR